MNVRYAQLPWLKQIDLCRSEWERRQNPPVFSPSKLCIDNRHYQPYVLHEEYKSVVLLYGSRLVMKVVPANRQYAVNEFQQLQKHRKTLKTCQQHMVLVLGAAYVTIHGTGQFVYLFELANARDVFALVENGWICSLARLMAVFVQMAEAVAALHAQNLLHTDVKPENFLAHCDDKGIHIMLTDLDGLSQVGDNNTSSGGTVMYNRPDRTLTMPSIEDDVHALGVSLFVMITGSGFVPEWLRSDLLPRLLLGEHEVGRNSLKGLSGLPLLARHRKEDISLRLEDMTIEPTPGEPTPGEAETRRIRLDIQQLCLDLLEVERKGAASPTSVGRMLRTGSMAVRMPEVLERSRCLRQRIAKLQTNL